jgi:hypothetical protein
LDFDGILDAIVKFEQGIVRKEEENYEDEDAEDNENEEVEGDGGGDEEKDFN